MRAPVVLATLCVALVGQAAGHTYFSPFDFLRHERGSVKLDSSVVIQVNTSLLKQTGEWVNVSWSGVSSPSKDDWIGVYSPPVNGTIDLVNHAPVKFQYAEHSSTHKKYGYGYFLFRLVNMRAPVIFGFITGGFDEPTLAAVSGVVEFENWNEPLQGHLVLNGDPTQMILVWVTRDVGSPVVKLGTESGHYTSTVKATSSSYSASDMCGSPATDFGYRDPGMLHQATITGLTPGRTYYYQFGDAVFGYSQQFQFTAAPLPGPDVTTRVSAYGDMGNAQEDDSSQVLPGQQPAINTTRLVRSLLPQTDLVLHIGDICYARGYASVWDEFFDEIQSVAASVPYMVCIGNHERDWPSSKDLFNVTDSGGECGVAYERRFPVPRPALDQPWYGFDYGSAHFIFMSTEHPFDDSSPQYQYLSNHLSSVDRNKTPWLIFSGHRPMYVDSTNTKPPDGEQPVATELRKYIEPLLRKYKVDLALWGHDHSYQRTCPVYEEKCVDDGTVHVVIGMAGQTLSTNTESPTPSWIVYSSHKHYGFSHFTTNSSTLLFQYIRDDSGEIQDTFVLTK